MLSSIIINMEQNPQYKKLEENLFKFISDLHRYYPSEGTDAFLKQFKELDMPKVIDVFYNKMKSVEDKLNKKDDSIFNEVSFVLLPGIDITVIWKNLTQIRKEKVWTYLQILYIQCDILLSKNTPEFDPYKGVGVGNNKDNYSVEEMFSGVNNMPPAEKPGISSVTNLLGINKMLNLDKLSNELKNMSKDDIDEATNNIKNLLGSHVDDKTTNLISNMLSSINEELKKDNSSSQTNPLDNIFKIAETVADKIKPSIQQDGIDMNKLWSSTQNLATKCKDDKGNPVFGNGPNPFDMLTKMMNGNMNEEECIEGYQKMLADNGMNSMQHMMGKNMGTGKKIKKNKKNKKK